jgi:hypothetical protein
LPVLKMTRSRELLLLAALFTGLNALKPLQIDDAAYYYYADHIARRPLDPYGFQVFWYQAPEPAQDVLAPPVLPYWWAVAIRLFGVRPYLWKLWLLPFGILFVFSLDALFRRFARGEERPLVWMTVLSPAFLPSLNLMLDVPALALSLSAIAVFLRGSDRKSLWFAVAAGAIAGVAMETKYTGLLGPVIVLLYTATVTVPTVPLSWRTALARLRLGLAASAVAALLFVAWESFMTWRYGESHFLHEFRLGDQGYLQKLAWWSFPLLAIVGGVAPQVGMLGLVALGRRASAIVTAGAVVAAGYLAVALFSAEIDLMPYAERLGLGEVDLVCCSLEQAIFTLFGAALVSIVAVIGWRLLRLQWTNLRQPRFWQMHRLDRFLVLWLALEVAGYFAMTPFGAVRRVMGIVVVGTLLVGRLLSLTRRSRRSTLINGVAASGIALGILFYAVDLREAWAWRAVVQQSAQFIGQHDPDPRIWYVGHWGFQFYAESAGMRPVVPAVHPARELLRAGDWLVVPYPRLEQQTLVIDRQNVEPIAVLVIEDGIALRTVRCFYGTGTGVPLEHHHGPRASVTIYRVKRDFEPVSGQGPGGQGSGVREHGPEVRVCRGMGPFSCPIPHS